MSSSICRYFKHNVGTLKIDKLSGNAYGSHRTKAIIKYRDKHSTINKSRAILSFVVTELYLLYIPIHFRVNFFSPRPDRKCNYKQIYLIHRLNQKRHRHFGSEWDWVYWQWMGTPHFQDLQNRIVIIRYSCMPCFEYYFRKVKNLIPLQYIACCKSCWQCGQHF